MVTLTQISTADISRVESIPAWNGPTTWAALNAATGGLSAPSKMPCPSYSIDARRCNVGSRLRNVAGSTCESCYACKGSYVWGNTIKAMERRYTAMRSDSVRWASAMVASIRKSGTEYFRWHDSGDIQGANHLHAIVLIARELPSVRFWIPTREYRTLRAYLDAGNVIPDNLAIRVSAPMVGSRSIADKFPLVSFVGLPEGDSAWDCPSYKTNNECGECRACWDTTRREVNYRLH